MQDTEDISFLHRSVLARLIAESASLLVTLHGGRQYLSSVARASLVFCPNDCISLTMLAFGAGSYFYCKLTQHLSVEATLTSVVEMSITKNSLCWDQKHCPTFAAIFVSKATHAW